MYPDLIRLLIPSDLTFAQQLCRAAGWNQTEADWLRLLQLGPEGCFLISADGQPAGTATTTVYSEQLAWIGMVLVHPAFRRRGLATRLMQHCLSWLRDGLGIPCIKLDATPAGQPLYRRLGFQIDAELHRAGIRQSMSRAADCYDNAFMEPCFGTIKTELSTRTQVCSLKRFRTYGMYRAERYLLRQITCVRPLRNGRVREHVARRSPAC